MSRDTEDKTPSTIVQGLFPVHPGDELAIGLEQFNNDDRPIEEVSRFRESFLQQIQHLINTNSKSLPVLPHHWSLLEKQKFINGVKDDGIFTLVPDDARSQSLILASINQNWRSINWRRLYNNSFEKTHFRKLSFKDCTVLKDSDLLKLSSHMISLDIRNCPLLTTEAINIIKSRSPQLESLYVTDISLFDKLDSLPSLENLVIADCPDADDVKVIETLFCLPNLRQLVIINCPHVREQDLIIGNLSNFQTHLYGNSFIRNIKSLYQPNPSIKSNVKPELCLEYVGSKFDIIKSLRCIINTPPISKEVFIINAPELSEMGVNCADLHPSILTQQLAPFRRKILEKIIKSSFIGAFGSKDNLYSAQLFCIIFPQIFDTLVIPMDVLRNSISNKDIQAFKWLVTKLSNIDTMDEEGKTAFFYALEFSTPDNFQELTELLIQRGARLDITDIYGNTTLMHSEAKNYTLITQLILDANPNIGRINKQGLTSLMMAVREKNYQAVEDLSSKYPDLINARDHENKTAIMYAAKAGDLNIVRLLVSKNTEVNIGAQCKDSDHVILNWAIKNEYKELAKLLIESNENLDYLAVYYNGQTLLMCSILYDCKANIVKKLLSKNDIDVNALDNNGRTAMMYAVSRYDGQKFFDIVGMLRDKGADPKIKDFEGLDAYRIVENRREVKDPRTFTGSYMSLFKVEYSLSSLFTDIMQKTSATYDDFIWPLKCRKEFEYSSYVERYNQIGDNYELGK